jgi:fatty acid desaturase
MIPGGADAIVCAGPPWSGSFPGAGSNRKTDAIESRHNKRRFNKMLWTIFVIFLILWLLGVLTSYTLGGLVHILLVVALVVLVIQLLQGRRSIL